MIVLCCSRSQGLQSADQSIREELQREEQRRERFVVSTVDRDWRWLIVVAHGLTWRARNQPLLILNGLGPILRTVTGQGQPNAVQGQPAKVNRGQLRASKRQS